MFNGCNSLYELPNISKFNVCNVINMAGLMNECFCLNEL